MGELPGEGSDKEAKKDTGYGEPPTSSGLVNKAWKWINQLAERSFGPRGPYYVSILGVIVVAFVTVVGVARPWWPTVSAFLFAPKAKEPAPIPPADRRRFSIGVAHLEGDTNHYHEKLIIEALVEFKGVETLRFDRTIELAGPRPEEAIKSAHKLAHSYLSESGGDVLLWGSVLGNETVKLHWTEARASGGTSLARRYKLGGSYDLPDNLFWGDLTSIIYLWVLTAAAEFRIQPDNVDRTQLALFVTRVEQLLSGTVDERWSLESRTQIQILVAEARNLLASPQIPFTPRSDLIAEFPLPSSGSGPFSIAMGADGNLWFSQNRGDRIGMITPQGVISEFPIKADAAPGGVCLGPDGNIWFTEVNANQIGRITTSGSIIEFPIATPASEPFAIVAGTDGNLWFTESQGNKIGRISPQGRITEFALPIGGQPEGIAVGSDGNVWFTMLNGDRVGRILVTEPNTITEYSTDALGGPLGITTGPDGEIWVTEFFKNRIVRIEVSQPDKKTAVQLASTVGPYSITTASDGNLWFTLLSGSRIARLTLDGVLTEFPLNPGSQPTGIAAGPDDDIWFTELAGNRIGRIKIPGN